MAEIYGNNTISPLLPRRVYRPNVGWRTERRFRGLMASLNAEAAAILAGSPAVEIQIDPPSNDVGEGVMTVSIPDAQDGSNADDNVHVVWGCPNSSRDRAIIDHPKFDALSAPNKDLLSKYYQDRAAGGLATTGDAQSFSDAIEKGNLQYAENVFTLRRTQTAPSGWTVPNLRQYVDVVFTRAQMISEFSPPTNILTQMPESTEGEYLCLRAELEQTDKGGWQVVMEWAHAPVAWSFVYTRWP
jgi:hypothetical protein